MQRDAWRTYLELALGLTEASRKKAKKAIKSLVNQSGASVDQVKSLTEELVETSLANREAIAKMVRGELDRALGVVGLASAEEVAELNDRVTELERRLQTAENAAEKAAPATPGPVPPTVPPAKDTATKALAKKTATKAAAAKTTPAKAPAKKTTAKKAVAKKAPARKAPAKKATPAAPDTPEAGNTP
jgi:polyhydroxyalkanoate synthesis regulator phasin